MDKPCLILCSGFHDPLMTQETAAGLTALPLLNNLTILIYPTQFPGSVLSGYGIRQFLLSRLGLPRSQSDGIPPQPVFFLAFSAGCVSAISAAHHWHAQGGRVGGFFAVDGWGVALAAPFPIYRLSHDRFTHDTSMLLGKGQAGFYADPAVSHLQFWRYLTQSPGHQIIYPASPQSAASKIFLEEGAASRGTPNTQASPTLGLSNASFLPPLSSPNPPVHPSTSLTGGQFLQHWLSAHF